MTVRAARLARRDKPHRVRYEAGMSRARLAPLLLAAIVGAAIVAPPRPAGADAAAAAGLETIATATGAETIAVTSRPVNLHAANRPAERVGRLGYRGGLVLRSKDARFGGFSALAISADGRTLTALSDKGFWLTATLSYDADGRLAGLGGATIGRLVGPGGRRLRRHESDAESLARLPGGGYAVAFEHAHRIRLYTAPLQALAAHPRRMPQPPDLAAAPRNGGIEALTRLADGRLLAITERMKAPRNSGAGGTGGEKGAANGDSGKATVGWVFEGKRWRRLSYALTGSFVPTGAATLPSGDVLMLERRFSLLSGVAARLQIVARDAIRAGARLEGTEIARLAPPYTVDNFEGVAVRLAPAAKRGKKGAGGKGAGEKSETLIYLISDDNFNPLQRTLLLMFVLEPPG